MSEAPATCPVQFGAQYVGAEDLQGRVQFTPADLAREAEGIGFDSVWVGDHVLHYVDGIASLGAMAAVTSRVAIGTNVIVMPFRPAAVTAKGVLTAALLAGGRRTILGVGVGGDVPLEFDVVNATLSERGAYTDEALEVITKFWTTEPVSHAGRWTKFEDAKMDPPLPRLPEIFVGGRSEKALRRALQHGTGYIPYLIDASQARSRFERVADIAAETDRDLTDFTFAVTTFMVTGQDRDAATKRAVERTRFKNIDADKLHRYFILGSPDEAADQIRQFINSGATHVVIGCHKGADDQLGEYLETMSQVLPQLRAECAAGLGAEARASLLERSTLPATS